jgi:hypothetical protein
MYVVGAAGWCVMLPGLFPVVSIDTPLGGVAVQFIFTIPQIDIESHRFFSPFSLFDRTPFQNKINKKKKEGHPSFRSLAALQGILLIFMSTSIH